MKININKKKYEVKSLSQLSFNEFNKVLIKAKVGGLDEYLSIFLDIDKDVLLKSEIKSHTLNALHAFIFDVDVTATIKDKPKAILFNEKSYYTDELELNTFGKAYYYDLYYQRYKAGAINEYQLGLYAISIAITDTLDDEIENNYKLLVDAKWTKYLSTAFFLLKKYRKPKKRSIMLLLRYTLGLKVVKWRITALKKKLKRWEKT